MTEIQANVIMMLRTELTRYDAETGTYEIWILLNFQKRKYRLAHDIELVNQLNTATVRPAMVLDRRDVDAIRIGETWYTVTLDEPGGF